MRGGARTAALLLGVVAVLVGLAAGPAAAQETPGTTGPGTADGADATPLATTWDPDLTAGEATGVVVADGVARLDPSTAFLAPADERSPSSPVTPTGLLTLPAGRLPAPTDEVGAEVTGSLPRGSTAVVDVRGVRANGSWSEWIPAGDGGSALPEPASVVQARLVLTGGPAAIPLVRGVRLTARPSTGGTEGRADGGAEAGPALSYRVFATREGLVGRTTANGHTIAERDMFVALPSRRALSAKDSRDYSVRVCASSGRCAIAPVWDVGPWNTRDDYWNPPDQRQEWKDLPQGVPQAQAAHQNGFNGGLDQFGRKVANSAGIDLGDGVFWDALGLKDNAFVTVEYLWTGTAALVSVETDAPVTLRAAPRADAQDVGLAADAAAVPAECAVGTGAAGWLQVGERQFLPASAVPDRGRVPTCA